MTRAAAAFIVLENTSFPKKYINLEINGSIIFRIRYATVNVQKNFFQHEYAIL